MRSTNLSNAILLLAANLSACAARTAPTLEPARVSSITALRADLATIFNAPEFDRITWGVSVRGIETDERLFELNPRKLLMPASNMKILTLAAAGERLGWDHRFETRLVACGPVQDGTLKGDLVVVGDGDPTIGDRAGDALGGHLFDRWAEELSVAGVRSVEGSLIGDDDAFDDDGVGAGWSWDDLAYSYAAPAGALTYDSNAAELLVRPGSAIGEPANLTIRPPESELTVLDEMTTSASTDQLKLDLRRSPGSSHLIVRGTIPLSTPELSRPVSVDNPTNFFVKSLERALREHGIDLPGPAIDVDKMASPPDLSQCRLLTSQRSASLAELAVPMMKLSLNLYAELLVKSLGRTKKVPGSTESGLQAIRDTVQGWGIGPENFALSDGSGLSRYNYVTAETLAAILRHMALDPRHAAPFAATLATAGFDGTLGNRMKGTAAEGNVQAKTGSFTGVRALSGYVHTRDGERLAFSILANGSNVAAGVVDAATDRALERLADFRRQPASR